MFEKNILSGNEESGVKFHALHRFFIALKNNAGACVFFWFIFFFIWRAWYNESVYGTYANCRGCFFMPTLAHDFWMLGAGFLFLAVGGALRQGVLRLLCRLVCIFLLVVVAADNVVGSIFNQRLLISDVIQFSGMTGANLGIVQAWFAPPHGIWKGGIGLVFLLSLVFLIFPSERNLRASLKSGGVALSAFILALLLGLAPVRYIHEYSVWNVVEMNRPVTRIKGMSPQYIEALQSQIKSMSVQCEKRSDLSINYKNLNVIVLLVESLSSWQSQIFGGEINWTPQIDKIAQDNHYFKNFHANSFYTLGGEISSISGRISFNPVGELYPQFSDYQEKLLTLPDIARKTQRESVFISTTDLSFVHFGSWLHALDFDKVEGNEHAFYDGMKRWQFGAPEDAALYARFLDWFDHRNHEKPFIAGMLTVSSHPPFISPETGRNNFEATFRYVDAQVGYFYQQLEKRNFFETGVLLILGDHRTMTPLRKEEVKRYGERAFSRVPLIVAGKAEMPKIVEEPFQQTDIMPSLAWLLGLEFCQNPFVGNIFRPSQAPQYVIHMRGDDRDRIDVYYGKQEIAGFKLDGDDSYWMTLPPPDREVVEAWINLSRIRLNDKR
jgi:phosphoglycerol transferase MdoB-like AlkP superfamily enzyme